MKFSARSWKPSKDSISTPQIIIAAASFREKGAALRRRAFQRFQQQLIHQLPTFRRHNAQKEAIEFKEMNLTQSRKVTKRGRAESAF